jgi:hypothetical protein
MTWVAGGLAVVLVLAGWRVAVEYRRLRAASERLEDFHRLADERAAAAELRPLTGHVAASSIHPPTTNGHP